MVLNCWHSDAKLRRAPAPEALKKIAQRRKPWVKELCKGGTVRGILYLPGAMPITEGDRAPTLRFDSQWKYRNVNNCNGSVFAAPDGLLIMMLNCPAAGTCAVTETVSHPVPAIFPIGATAT